jgi:prepilin-type processing-associated H-X9-DG protein
MNSKCKEASAADQTVSPTFRLTAEWLSGIPGGNICFCDGSAGAERNGGALPPAHATSAAGCYHDKLSIPHSLRTQFGLRQQLVTITL